MNSRFRNTEVESHVTQKIDRHSQAHQGYKKKAAFVIQVNPHLLEYEKLLDHFHMGASTPFDETLLEIMRRLSEKRAITQNQFIWFSDKVNQIYCNSSMLKAYHEAEAFVSMEDFKESDDPLSLISAAENMIGAKQPVEALKLLREHQHISENKNNKVVALFYQQQAKALYDLRDFVESKAMANMAYASSKEEMATLLLLGATSLHLDMLDDAVNWYSEARKLFEDVCVETIQADIKNTVKNIPMASRHLVVKGLYARNPEQYKFLRGLLPKKMKSA